MRSNQGLRQAMCRVVALVATVILAGCGGSTAEPAAPGTVPQTASAAATATQAATAIALPTPPGVDPVPPAFVAPAEACAGQSSWTGVPALVIRLADAWHEHDAAKRRAILDEVWAEDGTYVDPFSDPVVGRDALSDVMGYGVAPGQYIELRSWSASDMHHGAIRLVWRHCCPSGLSLLEGTDLATIDEDGRIGRVVSFWSHFVDEPAEGACAGPLVSPGAPTTPAPTAAATCARSEADRGSVPPVAAGYVRAWNERDPGKRLALLGEVWAADGTYADPYVDGIVAGREALSKHIGGFLETASHGASFQPRPTTEGDAHHGYLRMPWNYCDADGKVVWVGDDILELDGEGRVVRNLGFFAL